MNRLKKFTSNITSNLRITFIRCMQFAVCAIWASQVNGEPTVQNNTITWPDNGWYQVQSASDYLSVCEGGLLCEVAVGRYIVINHSTKQRWTITVDSTLTIPPVSDEADSVDTRIPIWNANTITWSDTGWYQVQRGDTYETICEGTTSCTVNDAGEYIVINHMSNERWTLSTNIFIPDDTGLLADYTVSDGFDDGYRVEGNTVFWADNGWYQLQSKNDYSTQCEGEQSCTVPDGVYNLINHTTGMRWVDIEIPSVDVGSPTVDLPIDDGSDAVIPADDITYQRYSSSAIEIAWSYPNTARSNLDRFDIFVDGEIFDVSNGASLFMEGILDTVTYSIEVVAVNNSGDASADANLFVPATDYDVFSSSVSAFVKEVGYIAFSPLLDINSKIASNVDLLDSEIECLNLLSTEEFFKGFTCPSTGLSIDEIPLVVWNSQLIGEEVDLINWGGERDDVQDFCDIPYLGLGSSCAISKTSIVLPRVWVTSSNPSVSCIGCGIHPLPSVNIDFDLSESSVLSFNAEDSFTGSFDCELDLDTGLVTDVSLPGTSFGSCQNRLNVFADRFREYRLLE